MCGHNKGSSCNDQRFVSTLRFRLEVFVFRMFLLVFWFALLCVPGHVVAELADTEVSDAQIQSALERSGDNRDQIEKALAASTPEQLRATRFLIAYMPERDLTSLSSKFIHDNVRLAYKARAATAWGEMIPESLFFNDVLPYVSMNERRDEWRAEFFERFLPLVKDCKTPTEAAQILNRDMYKILDVQYHARKRPKPDQSPYESIEAKYASCTGLSILLIDACRAVCVPARFAGTPLWAKKRGNHSWVEIWDGKWHFTGACEYNAKGLDQTWFQRDASHAIKDNPLHAIYASSWRMTGTSFPMIWERDAKYVAAVNVTDRYAAKAAEIPTGKIMLTIEIYNAAGQRVSRQVTIRQADEIINAAKTKGQGDDSNNKLELFLDPNTQYTLVVDDPNGSERLRSYRTTKEQRQTWKVFLNAEPANAAVADPIAKLEQALAEADLDYEELSQATFSQQPLTKDQAEQATALLWQHHLKMLRKTRAEEMKQKSIQLGDKNLKFDYIIYGDKPATGRSLYISLHGGGGAPARVNDQQWENQKKLYQPKEGVYLAPRAPTDTWNLWHQAHIDPLFDRLIENLVAFEDVDPNRVYVMGYSAGGDGVYQIAPRMADRWAAAAMMAGHPNDASPLGLRNIGFALHMGANDGAYKRNEVARQWKARLAELQAADPEGYRHQAVIHEGKGHWMGLQDAIAVPWMAEFTRNPHPHQIVWQQDDVTQPRFYWLAVEPGSAKKGAILRAQVEGQVIDLNSDDVSDLRLLLHDELIDLDQPVVIRFNEKEVYSGQVKRTIGDLLDSLNRPGAWAATSVQVSSP